MKRFYRENENRFIEFGFNDKDNVWYADLIDINSHIKISTLSNKEKIGVLDDIVKENWFTDHIVNFSRFIEDVIQF